MLNRPVNLRTGLLVLPSLFKAGRNQPQCRWKSSSHAGPKRPCATSSSDYFSKYWFLILLSFSSSRHRQFCVRLILTTFFVLCSIDAFGGFLFRLLEFFSFSFLCYPAAKSRRGEQNNHPKKKMFIRFDSTEICIQRQTAQRSASATDRPNQQDGMEGTHFGIL
ncbi:hypothetical protein BDW75DRAFT_33236 [Aspergillus navahoensis]